VALYTKDSKDRVRDAVDFVELVSARTELRKAGANRYEGRCPFHDERTPSFGIDPTQKVYYCFGCQASGDLFTFVQETEGVPFRDALELLADRYGIELQLEKEDPREEERRRRKDRLLDLLKRTTDYYERYLWESKEAAKAREYLKERGLGEEVLREYQVGYAPSAWDKVLLASRRGGFSEAELYATGLAQRSQENGRVYDRFRSRIMFPLANTSGKVLGFGARAMSAEQRPKYLNTSDNDIYHKGRQLYGSHLARSHAAKANALILCEGYTDVIALHQAGMRNAVGLMGTALTEDQVRELARMAHTVLLALDADNAGQEAMLRASVMAEKLELELKVVPLPAGADPAELVQRQGPEAVEVAVARAVPFVRFLVERALDSGDTNSSEGRERILDQLRPVFKTLQPGVVRMDLTRMVSSRFGEPDTTVERELSEVVSRPASRSGNGSGGGASSAGARARAVRQAAADPERAFLALCIAAPEAGGAALASVSIDEDFSSELLRRAARHLLGDGVLADPMGRDLDEDPELKGLLAELIVEAGREAPRAAMLEVQRLQLELARMERGIQRAKGREDSDVSALAHRRAELKLEFDRAYTRVLEETGEPREA
jgi:DNA primase